ncbi:unnamed protein product [Rhizophagus irregularis]|nr:unnamed protein product [Rhizophagus irregularis]
MDSLEDYNQNIHDGPSGGKESPIHNVQAAWSPATYELVSEILKVPYIAGHSTPGILQISEGIVARHT